MKIIYKDEDIFPLTVAILKMCVNDYLCNSYRLMIEQDFPHLRDLVITDFLDHNDVALLLFCQRRWFTVIRCNLEALNSTVDAIAELYELNLQDIIDDERIKLLADDVCMHILEDKFNRDGKEAESDEDFKSNFEWYSMSVIAVVNWLCAMIINNGETDTKLAWVRDINEFINEHYEHQEHFFALQRLQDLGWRLGVNHTRLSEVNFDRFHLAASPSL